MDFLSSNQYLKYSVFPGNTRRVEGELRKKKTTEEYNSFSQAVFETICFDLSEQPKETEEQYCTALIPFIILWADLKNLISRRAII